MSLPFLNHSKWPASRESEERTVNPSSHKQTQDFLVDELLNSLEHKDKQGVTDALVAIVHALREEEMESHEA